MGRRALTPSSTLVHQIQVSCSKFVTHKRGSECHSSCRRLGGTRSVESSVPPTDVPHSDRWATESVTGCKILR